MTRSDKKGKIILAQVFDALEGVLVLRTNTVMGLSDEVGDWFQ